MAIHPVTKRVPQAVLLGDLKRPSSLKGGTEAWAPPWFQPCLLRTCISRDLQSQPSLARLCRGDSRQSWPLPAPTHIQPLEQAVPSVESLEPLTLEHPQNLLLQNSSALPCSFICDHQEALKASFACLLACLLFLNLSTCHQKWARPSLLVQLSGWASPAV